MPIWLSHGPGPALKLHLDLDLFLLLPFVDPKLKRNVFVERFAFTASSLSTQSDIRMMPAAATDGDSDGAGYEWVGWRNDTYGTDGKPVEMIFEFDSVRNFSAIVLHTNNMFTKDVQVSHKMEIQPRDTVVSPVIYTRSTCGLNIHKHT